MLDTRCLILDQTQTDNRSKSDNAGWLLLCPGMELTVDSFQSLLIDVCIDLCGPNIGVAKHFLDDAQIGAVPQEMRGEAVSQKVRINVLFESGAPGMFLHNLPDTRCG